MSAHQILHENLIKFGDFDGDAKRSAYKSALRAFRLARRRALWEQRRARWKGVPFTLPVLAAQSEATTFHSATYAGTRPVALAAIAGSENRAHDFSSGFNPLRDDSEARWVAVATALLNGETLPPVELIEVQGKYYVRDGHHRISAARALGFAEIDAVITTYHRTNAA